MIEQIKSDNASDDARSGLRSGLRQRFFAWAHASGESSEYEAVVNPYRRNLLADLSGTVLEIGAGTGENFAYYPSDIRWIGIEPNAFMQERLMETAKRYGISGELRTGLAEHLPVEDASVDAVVSTFVLCSVSNPDQALGEIMRVLRPGGRLIVIEHVAGAPDSGLYRRQRMIKPLWKLFADGCNPDRNTAAAIERAGFSQVEIERFSTPIPIASPHIAGYAIK